MPGRKSSENSNGGMTVQQAGRKGGQTVSKKYGPEFYTEIGKLGGRKRRDMLGHEGYVDMGRKGGQTVSQKYGPDFYTEIGRKGGEEVKKKYGAEFYEKIGKRGGARVKELIANGKQAKNKKEEE